MKLAPPTMDEIYQDRTIKELNKLEKLLNTTHARCLICDVPTSRSYRIFGESVICPFCQGKEVPFFHSQRMDETGKMVTKDRS